MPSLGADMEAGTLVAWRKKPGERVKRGDIIAEVETDKGVIEVEVFVDGVVERYLVEPGHRVPVGTPLAMLAESAPAQPSAAGAVNALGNVAAPAPETRRSSPPQPPSAPLPEARKVSPSQPPSAAGVAAPLPVPTPPSVPAPPSVRRRARELGIDLREALAQAQRVNLQDLTRISAAETTPKSSPAARKRAHELSVDLRGVHGTGPGGAIVLADVEAHAAHPQPSAAEAPAADPKRALRRAIAAAMARSKREIPHYYLTTTIDLLRAQTWVTRYNLEHAVSERIVPGALLMKASALAVRAQPEFNCLWQDDAARQMPDVHLGVAIALRGGGLVAPALHHADTLALAELMKKLQDLTARARAGTLRSSELSDATITVTSLGERGVESVLPIIYPPQTAMIGFGRIADRPWVTDAGLAVRPLVTASLAADHRVTDGHLGARFLNSIADLLQRPEQL